MADRLLGLSGRPAESTESVLQGLEEVALADAFAVQLVQRLRDQDESITPALVWLDRKLGAQGTSPGKVVAREHHSQAAANATVRNIITSMRWMSSIDWLEFFESVSLVDEELRAVPTYQAMDFVTRDEYRKQIEVLSRGSGRSEIEIAREAVLLARDGEAYARVLRRHHISDSEFQEALHEAGCKAVDEVRQAVLEPDGRISIVKKQPGGDPPPDANKVT